MAILVLHPIFTENGFVLSKKLNIPLVNEINDEKVLLVYGAHNAAPMLLEKQRLDPNIKYVILNSESYKSPSMSNKYYLSLMRNNTVFDYTKLNSFYLGSLGIRSLSQHWMDFPNYTDQTVVEKDIDILFVGTKSLRRENLYTTLIKQYPKKKIIFDFTTDNHNHTKYNELICRAKFVINIPYYEHNILETHRINKALSLGAVVVTHYSGDKEMDRIYKPYVYQTHDFLKFFDKKNHTKKLKPYEELAHHQNHNVLAQMLWCLSMLS